MQWYHPCCRTATPRNCRPLPSFVMATFSVSANDPFRNLPLAAVGPKIQVVVGVGTTVGSGVQLSNGIDPRTAVVLTGATLICGSSRRDKLKSKQKKKD